jgi:hypothetical protein
MKKLNPAGPLVFSVIFFSLILTIIPSSFAAGTGNIQYPVVNMFDKPDAQNGSVISQAIYGTPVVITAQQGRWIKVQTPDQYQGWVESHEVKSGHYGSSRMLEVRSPFAVLYRVPDTTRYQPAMTIPFGTQLTVIKQSPAQEGRWWQVRLVDGNTAFIQKGDIRLNPKPLNMPQMLAMSRQFVGAPYVWGGKSSFGFDCSGFVQMLYQQIGVNLPRDGNMQIQDARLQKVGQDLHLDAKALKPGDLLYFGIDGKTISHAGVYIGNGKYISSTTHDRPMVQIANINDAWWQKIFITARRLKST